MNQSKLAPRVSVLCGLVIGLMAIVAGGIAQAEPLSKWTYINPTTKVLEEFTKTLEAKPILEFENKTASLLFKTKSGTHVEILCTGAEFDEGGLLGPEGKILLGRLKFTGCVTLLNGVVSKNCEPQSEKIKGLILTKKGDGLLVLHKLEPSGVLDAMILLLPTDENTKLVEIELGELCSIGETVPVEGHLDLFECKNELKVHKVTHLFEEVSTLRLLKALGQPAQVNGSINVSLGLTHKGFEWAGLPG